MSEVIESSDLNFEDDVIKSDIPVIVDFWAPWCAPCKALAPTLEEISVEQKDKVKIVKINVDDHTENAGKFGIRSIPTLLIFNKGELKNQIVGALPKNEIEKLIMAEI
jgi:thioredoxin 1|tara:strand:+ start:1969 stop:2292 length:324 start_codon:yes stop_codon:yes gene_type:complete